MKLSASLLALVAAVPALVSAVPMETANPGGGGAVPQDPLSDADGAVPQYPLFDAPAPAAETANLGGHGAVFQGTLRHVIKNHIDLATLAVIFIAENFENPPSPDSAEMKEGAVLTLSENAGGFVEGNLDLDHLLGMLSLHDIASFPIWEPLAFKRDNFELVPISHRQIHVLCEGTQFQAKRLWRFYNTIWDRVDPRAEEKKLPRIPAILRSVYSDLPNLQAELTNDDVRKLLLYMADELSTVLHDHLNAEDFEILDWIGRLMFLDMAISEIQIYDDEPLCHHGKRLLEALVCDIHGPDHENHVLHLASEITHAANAAVRIYGPKL